MHLLCFRAAHLAEPEQLTDMEVVSACKGTDSMRALILGREATGVSAFTRTKT